MIIGDIVDTLAMAGSSTDLERSFSPPRRMEEINEANEMPAKCQRKYGRHGKCHNDVLEDTLHCENHQPTTMVMK